MSNKSIAVYAEAMKREAEEATSTRHVTPESTGPRAEARAPSRESWRGSSRDISRELPSRDEIQAFSFQLRDELKVKVQAEVPHPWQKELEELARELDVKKLELYRFIIGEFLGKVTRQRSP